MPEHLVSLVSDMYDGAKAKGLVGAIRTPHGLTKQIDVTVGVHQGSALSPFLFLLTIDVLVKGLRLEGSLKTILYADDIVLLADSREGLQGKVQKWQEVLAERGLRLSVKNTKFLSSEYCTESIVEDYAESIERVEDSRYLGSDSAADGSVDQAVNAGINAAWTKRRESTGILEGAPERLKGRCTGLW